MTFIFQTLKLHCALFHDSKIETHLGMSSSLPTHRYLVLKHKKMQFAVVPFHYSCGIYNIVDISDWNHPNNHNLLTSKNSYKSSQVVVHKGTDHIVDLTLNSHQFKRMGWNATNLVNMRDSTEDEGIILLQKESTTQPYLIQIFHCIKSNLGLLKCPNKLPQRVESKDSENNELTPCI